MSIHSTDLLECMDLRNQAGEEEGRFPRRWYKPVTAVIHSQNGDKRVMKKYPNGVFPLSLYFRLLANHEYRMLIRADGTAFTPSLASRCSDDPWTITYRYIDGIGLKDAFRQSAIPEDFFVKLYASVQQLHRYGIVHLDLGNSGNVLCSTSGDPKIIDFGSALPLYLLPRSIGSWARKRDLLGVLKLWYRFDRRSMPEATLRFFRTNYKKNIFTPKRFLKALKRCLANPSQARQGSSPVAAIIGLFISLLLLTFII